MSRGKPMWSFLRSIRKVKPRLLYRNLGGWDLPQIYLTGLLFWQKGAAQLSRWWTL